jgi:hypothetical protein
MTECFWCQQVFDDTNHEACSSCAKDTHTKEIQTITIESKLDEESYKKGASDTFTRMIEMITPFQNESRSLAIFLEGVQDGIRFRQEIDSLTEGKEE